jgi:hypothetical protein
VPARASGRPGGFRSKATIRFELSVTPPAETPGDPKRNLRNYQIEGKPRDHAAAGEELRRWYMV